VLKERKTNKGCLREFLREEGVAEYWEANEV
jgi:hypothetical protein